MHPTLSDVNFKTSLQLFFRNEFENRPDPIPFMFDKTTSDPFVSGMQSETGVDKWVTVLFTFNRLNVVSLQTVEFICCTRRDPNNIENDKLSDELKAILFPENGHLVIPFINTQNEQVIGSIFFLSRMFANRGIELATDGTKFKIIAVPFKWVAVI